MHDHLGALLAITLSLGWAIAALLATACVIVGARYRNNCDECDRQRGYQWDTE